MPPSFFARRQLVALALALGAGVWLGVQCSPPPVWLLCGLALALSLCVLLRLRGARMLPGAACAALVIGLLLGGRAVSPALPPKGKFAFEATVEGDALARENGSVRCYLENVTRDGELLGRAYWTYYPSDDTAILPTDGQIVRFTGSVYHPSGQVNPFGFDFKLYLLRYGVSFGISGAEALVIDENPDPSWKNKLFAVRRRAGERLDMLFGEEGQLARALLLGDKSDLPEDMRQWFSRSGLAHILSVSGLHVGLLMAFLLRLLKPLRASPVVLLLLMSAVTLAYCAFLSFQAPVVRASVLLLCSLLARACFRQPDPLTTLSLAFILILLFNPLELFAPGFQLSFSAVLGIVLLGDRMGVLTRRVKSAWKRRVATDYMTCVNASVGVLLPSCAHFGQFSVIGLFINPFACLAVAPMMIGCLAALLSSFVSVPVAQALAVPVQFLMRLFLAMARTFGDLSFAALPAQAPPWPTAVAIILTVVMLTRFVLINTRMRAVIIALAAVFALVATQCMANRDVRYTQFSAGNADAAVIEDGNTTFVIDAGENGGDLVNYLLANGRRVDTLFLTHLHIDHTGGLADLLDARVRIDRIVVPERACEQDVSPIYIALLERAREAGIPVTEVARGDSVSSERVRIDVLWPITGTVRADHDANDYSLALLCELDGVTLLNAGDLSGIYERYAARPADILKIAHHGSRNSTSEAFLAAVHPRVALLSTSGRQYMPSPVVTERLAGIATYRTDVSGAVIVTIRENAAQIAGFLRGGDDP